MDMEFLGDSSAIQAAGFKGGFLTIQFTDGSIYTYEDVPVSTWRSLKMSVSKGYFFNKSIRGMFSFVEGTVDETGPLKYIDQGALEDIIGDSFEGYQLD